MTDNRFIRRSDALKAIDPGHGDFHAGDYNAVAALPTYDIPAMLATARREALEEAAVMLKHEADGLEYHCEICGGSAEYLVESRIEARTLHVYAAAIRALAASPPTPISNNS